MAKFVVTKRGNGEFQFVLKNDDQVLLSSEGYSSMSGCENGIESVRKNSQEEGRYAHEVAKNGKHYFNLKAGNGQIIGTSPMHNAKADADKNAESVQKMAAKATIENLIDA